MSVIRRAGVLAFAIVVLALPALAGAQGANTVSGTITYRDRSALPANAVVTVQIARVYADRGPEIIAEQSFATNGAQPPLAYSIARPWEPGIPVLGNLLNTMIGFLVYLVVVYLLGRLLGGDGKFGELAYDIALFWTPVAIVGAVVNLFSFGWFSCLTAPLAIFVTFYGLYLTYLGVQSGLNLPPRRALVVVLIPALFYLSLFCLLIAAFVALTGLQVSG